MPRKGSDLKSFLVEALSTKKYRNLFYLDESEVTFRLCCPRKDSHEFVSENIQIFKDWDMKKNHKFEYSYSRQRLESALKRSIYLTLVSSRKDTYDFRFSTSEEKIFKNEKNGSTSMDNCTSSGESHSSSLESSYSLTSLAYTNSPIKSLCNSTVDKGAESLEFTKETFVDDSNDLQNFLKEEIGNTESCFDAPVLDPTFTAALHESILQDLCSTDCIDYQKGETVPLVADSLTTPMECELETLPGVNGIIVEPPKNQQSTEKCISVLENSGCRISEENVGIDLQIVQSILQVISSNNTVFEDSGYSKNIDINNKIFLVNGCYLVTLKKNT